MPDVARAGNVEELRALARRFLPRVIFDSVDGGAEDEVTLARNREVFEEIGFVPRTLADVSGRSQEVDLFGTRSRMPVIVAPMGLLGILRPNAEIMLARAAAAMGVPIALATGSSTSIERLAEEAPAARRWFQLYPFQDEAINRSLLDRAARTGYEVLVVTTDTQVAPNRDRDRRNGFSLAMRPSPRLAFDVVTRPAWCWRMAALGGLPRFETLASEMGGEPSVMETAEFFLSARNWNPTFENLARLRKFWRGPFVVKGLLSADEARKVLDLGADGVVLSNHGGRNLDGAVSPMNVLPEIAEEIGHRMAIFIDSGFRRGSDVIKALSLGAKAVLLGRAMAWGVAAGGEVGALRALTIFRDEIDRVMAFLGCPSLSGLDRSCIRFTSARRIRDSSA